MEFSKEKYSRSELEMIIKEISLEYENKLKSQKDRIFELVENLKNLQAELEQYKNKDDLIKMTLLRSEEKSLQLEEETELQYNTELNFINEFNRKFKNYIERFSVKDKNKDCYKEEVEFSKKLNGIIDSNSSDKIKIEKLDKTLSETEPFNPRQKVEDFLNKYDKNEDGFNLEEVLNPGKLDLEELCKELGVMDGKQK